LLRINRLAYRLVEMILEEPEYYGVIVDRLPSGATLIDMGIEAQGGYEAGLMASRIAMGGAGTATLGYWDYEGLTLPTVIVSTDHPPVSLLGSQLAGWKIRVGDYAADGSGPARALALKPRKLYEKIGYRDDSDVAVLVLEAHRRPPDEAARFIAEACGVEPSETYIVLTSTNTLAGMVQISSRVLETGLFRLDYLGLDPRRVLYGAGHAPIMPLHADLGAAMGRAEDAITYGGVTSYIVDADDETLRELSEKAPSSTSKMYGKPSLEVYRAVDFDFTKVDPSLFAPAQITLTGARTGTSFKSGGVNAEVLRRSAGL
jgi:methenyltetrahydromethanopterin cyclohydrolase